MRSYKKGMYISVEGSLALDPYMKELAISANKIRNIGNKKAERKDDSKVKRVELNARTRMSTMDGINSAKDYLERAQQ